MATRSQPDHSCRCNDDTFYTKVRLIPYTKEEVQRYIEYSEVASKQIISLHMTTKQLKNKNQDLTEKNRELDISNLELERFLEEEKRAHRAAIETIRFLEAHSQNMADEISTLKQRNDEPEEHIKSKGSMPRFDLSKVQVVPPQSGAFTTSDSPSSQVPKRESTTESIEALTITLDVQPRESDQLIISTSPDYQLPACPATAASSDWFPAALTFVNVDLGKEYVRLLKQWIQLEEHHGWRTRQSGLKATFRPKQLKKWKDRKAVVLSLGDVPDFAESFWGWWCALQPAWRTFVNDKPVRATHFGKVWTSLNHYGEHGWVKIIACLMWWGSALKSCEDGKSATLHQGWLAAVEDVSTMLEGLLCFLRN